MFLKEDKNTKNNNYVKIAALLIHAAKIDENYSNQEEEIIKEALLKFGADNQNIEENSNQILDFTREVKTMKEDDKISLIETLWRIIYSNKDADLYETSLMRRLAGLLYIDSKIMGDIKEKIKKENL